MTALLAPARMMGQTPKTHIAYNTTQYNYTVYPIQGDVADTYYQKNQMIIPESELQGMIETNGVLINRLRYYIQGSGSSGDITNIGNWTVSIGVTTKSELTAIDESTDLTQVYSGPMTFEYTNGYLRYMTFAFDQEFHYTGGNLLIQFTHDELGSSRKSLRFYAQYKDGASCRWYKIANQNYENVEVGSYVPRTQFTYVSIENPDCFTPRTPVASDVTYNSATVTWTPRGQESAWEVKYSTDEDFDPDTEGTLVEVEQNASCVLQDLDELTSYYVCVRAKCSDDSNSGWSEKTRFASAQLPVVVDAEHPYLDDFEGDAEQRWAVVNGAMTNLWYFGTYTRCRGQKSMYITSHNGAGAQNYAWYIYGYNIYWKESAEVYACKTFSLTAGKTYELSYDWKGNGNLYSAYMRVALLPASTALNASASGSLPSPSEWTAILSGDNNSYNLCGHPYDWVNELHEFSVDESGDYIVVFAWYNNTSTMYQPAAAVDDFILNEKIGVRPEFVEPEPDPTQVELTWDKGDAESWELVYSENDFDPNDYDEDDEVTLVEVDGTPSGKNGQQSYTLTVNPESEYFAYVRGVLDNRDGQSTTRWSDATNFTTGVSCHPVENLEVGTVSTDAATVTWTDNNHDQGPWNVRYREANSRGTSTTYGFENGLPEGWVAYSNTGSQWTVSEESPYQGSQSLRSANPIVSTGTNGNLTNDAPSFLRHDIIFIPGFEYGGYVTFYAKGGATIKVGNYNGTVKKELEANRFDEPFFETYVDYSEYTLYTVDLSNYAGTGTLYIENTYSNSGYSYSNVVYIDDLTIYTPAEWTTVQVSSPTCNMEALTPGTPYQVQVQAQNSETDKSQWTVTQFATGLCNPEEQCAISYTLQDSYGDGWNGASISVWYGSSLVASLTIEDGNGEVEGELPLCPDNNYTFMWTSGNYDSECSFTIYDAEGTELLHHDADEEFVSDLLLQYEMVCPSCLKPAGLTLTEHSSTSATFSWIASANASAWEYAYSSDNEHWSQTQAVEGTPTCTIENLSPSSQYYFRVRANCGDGDYSVWATFDFYTDCGTITVDAEHPYMENFDDIKGWGIYDADRILEFNILPRCWSYLNNASSEYNMYYPTLFGEHYYYDNIEGGEPQAGESVDSYSYPTYLRFRANYEACEQYAILPAMSNVNGLQLKFMAHQADFWSYYESVLHVGVMTDPTDASTFTEVKSYVFSVPVYEELTVYFDQYELQEGVDDYYIAFKVVFPEDDYYDISIDDVSVSVLPSCLAPYELAVSNIGENDVTLSWAPNGDETAWQVRYSSDKVNWTIVDYTEAEPGQMVTESLGNLDHNTLYYVQVRANCGGSYSDWSRQNKFRTACSSGYQDVPYFEDFDSYNAFDDRLPQCWDYINTSHSTLHPANQAYPEISNGVEGYEANNYLYFLIFYYDYLNYHYEMDPQNQYAILPRMENIGDLQLNFSGMGEANNYWTDFNCQVNVGVFDDDGIFHLMRTVETSRTGYYGNYLVTFDGYEGSGRIAFLVETPQQFGSRVYESLVKIDNISVTPKLSYKKFIADGNWSDASCWENGEMPTSASDNVLISATAVIPSDCVAVCGNIDFDGNNASLTIEDGGQLMHNNSGVTATVKKHITPYSESLNDHWNLIGLPITDVKEAWDVADILSGDYDLYYFDQNHDGEQWRNFEDNESGWFRLKPKKGYLYANSDDVTLEFRGELYPTNADQAISLDYIEGKRLAGWNLIGNPFACQAYLANGMAYYRMNAGGTAIESAMAGTAIAPMEGVFVKASGSGQTAVFTATRQRSDGHLNIRLSHNQGRAIDNAIIGFGESGLLLKVQLMSNASKIYFTEDDKDYSIVSVGKVGEQPLNFTTSANGSYTLTFSLEEVRLSYLHLIDNMTGADVDLLETPTYTFNAKSTDYESRFKLVFATIGDADGNDDFAFFSNGNWVVVNDGEAVVQVIDMNGRILSSETINGSAQVNVNAACGLYVMRLVNGEKVKTQKIVVQ